MGWFQSLFGIGKKAANDPSDDRYFEPFSAPNAAGIKVTQESALKCAAVFRCVTIMADTISTCDLGIFRYRIDGDPYSGMDPVPDHPIDDLIGEQPNKRQSASEFWGMMIFHALMNGVSYAEIKPGQRGFVDRLEPIKPTDILSTDLLSDGTLRLNVRDHATGGTRVLLQEEFLRIPGMTADGVSGLRTVDLASESIALLMAADQYAARVFSNNINLGGVLTHPGKLGKEAGDRLLSRLMQRFAGVGNAHRPMVLQEGMKYEKASMTAQEAQLLDARRAQVRDISNYFGGVPLHLLGVDDQTNRATVEEQWLNFVRCSIRPWVIKIQQAIRRDLILAPKRFTAVFNLDDLEAGNMAARSEYFFKALGSGGSPPWLTQNEVRVSEGWNQRSEKHADELAKGTNPDQAKPPAPKPSPEPEPEDDEEASVAAPKVEQIDNTPSHDVIAMFRKETTALRKLHIKHAGDHATFRKAVTAFYGGFASQVAERLDITKEQAKAWCKNRSDRIGGANDIAAAIDALEEELKAVVAAP